MSSKPKIFLALPVYTGLQGRTFQSVVGCLHVAECHIQVLSGCPELPKARSELVAAFLETTCEYLFFIDSDIGFDPQVLRDLLSCGSPLVTATYREKNSPHHWTCAAEQALEEMPITQRGQVRTIDVWRAGLGCTLIRRDVFVSIQTFNRELMYQSDATQKLVCHMFAPFIEKEEGIPRLISEDTAFYRRARQIGVQAHCLLDATIDHSGIVANLGVTLDTVSKRGRLQPVPASRPPSPFS
jgi:hypothetical protein